ncbi:MAG: HAD family hydrolase [Halanaerobium sp.]|nr:HAD family hydrolase [Halanaerobium sp.]
MGEINIRHILFDLDGTLLPLDIDTFIPRYFEALAARFHQMVEPEQFINWLLEATEEMIRSNDEEQTNQEVFMEGFFQRIEQGPEEIMPILEDFYQNKYPELVRYLPGLGRGQEMVELALEEGFTVTIATNPLFPREAIIERLRWGNLEGYPYQLITAYEDMHFCKPNPRYYQEIMDRIGARPEECLMVGNDTVEDMVAGKLGIKTFLLTDFIIEKENSYQPDYRGDTDDFLQWLDEYGQRQEITG